MFVFYLRVTNRMYEHSHTNKEATGEQLVDLQKMDVADKLLNLCWTIEILR